MTGGVPRYLEEIDPGASAGENIGRLCYSPKGVLREDFDEMFNDVITKQPTFTAQVVRTLLDSSKSVAEIAKALGISRGGRISEAMEQLEETGIVSADVGKNPQTGENARETRYRLKDNYSRFYLKYVEPAKEMIDKGAFSFGSLESLDGYFDAVIPFRRLLNI